jgi:hypothetical protein
LRVVAFAGSGKTTALRLLALADTTPALYLAYNKSTQLAAQARFPAHVACRTMHSLAFRAMRMFEQQRRLERKLTGGEVAERLAIPALDGLRPGSVRARASPDSSSFRGAATGGQAASKMPSTVTVLRRRSSLWRSAGTCWCG